MVKHSEKYYDIQRNLDPTDGINMLMCGKGSCKCPSVNIHKDLDTVILGGKEEGYSTWTKEQFSIMVEQIKKGKFDGYIKNIRDGWVNYLKASGPQGVDPEIEEVALERAEVCKGCEHLQESGLFRFVNQIFTQDDGSKINRKIRHIIRPGSEDAEKYKDDVVRGFRCGQCGCGFPANVYAPDKKCPLDKWKR